MHAHRCEVCARQGINTIWIHGDDQAGNPESHTCPKCGQKEWKKWLVPVGQLPAQGHAQYPTVVVPLTDFIAVLMYASIIFLSIVLIIQHRETIKAFLSKKVGK